MDFEFTPNNDIYWFNPNLTPLKDWAVFLDRDGVIIEEVHLLKNIKDLYIYPESFEAIRKLNHCNIPVFLTTNQTTVCRNLVNVKFINKTHRIIEKKLEKLGIHLDGILCCLHHPEADLIKYRTLCSWRKPDCGMFEFIAKKYNLDLKKSFGIGDKARDLLAYQKAGMHGILVKTGYGGADPFYKAKPNNKSENILEAVNYIINKNL